MTPQVGHDRHPISTESAGIDEDRSLYVILTADQDVATRICGIANRFRDTMLFVVFGNLGHGEAIACLAQLQSEHDSQFTKEAIDCA